MSASDREQETLRFQDLITRLSAQSAAAAVSRLAPALLPLRRHLLSGLSQMPGVGESLLAEPLFELVLDWQTDARDMTGLAKADILHPRTVEALHAWTQHQKKEYREHAFPKDRHPFIHQVEAWTRLRSMPARSIAVSSGTGSGKTECFLVPILDDLVRESETAGHLTGVRALMLYPLNALINSQRDRLRAWTYQLGANVRFALYNGNTPDKADPTKVRAAQTSEVLDRRTLRNDPPPILVTNPTMLEYALIRKQDSPIIASSQGKLRWIVLDEAHTYVGSSAAEIALLLRRVAHAFGSRVEDLHFIATSATIGSDDQAAEDRLRSFVADVAGVAESRVDVIFGTTVSAGRRTDDLAAIEAGLRKAKALPLSELTSLRLGRPAPTSAAVEEDRATLAAIDDWTDGTKRGDRALRLRGHFFHRTIPGVWACLNSDCEGRKSSPLDDSAWKFGRVFQERRTNCSDCGSMVFELALCRGCGREFVLAEEIFHGGRSYLRPRPRVAPHSDAQEYAALAKADAGEAEGDDAETEEEEALPDELHGVPKTLAGDTLEDGRPYRMRLTDGEEISHLPSDPAVSLWEVATTRESTGAAACPHCGEAGRNRAGFTNTLSVGAAFFLQATTPTLVSALPPLSTGLPLEGRRLITFTDSRQGTARFALSLQLDAERNFVRSFIYHSLVGQRLDAAAQHDVSAIRAELEESRGMLARVGNDPGLRKIVDARIADLERTMAEASASGCGRMKWADLESKLAREEEVQRWMRAHSRELAMGDLDDKALARLCLIRELARRSRNGNTVETLGLVRTEYPLLKKSDPPATWKRRGLSAEQWKDFLSILMDHLVRARSAVVVDRDELRWIGLPMQPRSLIGPEGFPKKALESAWPKATNKGQRTAAVLLLERVLGVHADDDGSAEIDECLSAAWSQIQSALTRVGDGRQLDLNTIELVESDQAWFCPVTRRLLPRVLSGFTPYVTARLSSDALQCRQFDLPRIDVPFWREDSGRMIQRSERRQRLIDSAEVKALSEHGAWSEIGTHVITFIDYFQTAEHSAQQNPKRLGILEKQFREGVVNVLSCSTTMEMGVDIGGLSGIAMNNAPPAPANYLQRAGRAGRRSETRSLAFTLCRANPHGEAVFRDPRWPFTTPTGVPRVALDSSRIVQRHVNALLLAKFFSANQDLDLTKYECGAFFASDSEDRSTGAAMFDAWVRGDARSDAAILEGVQKIAHRSILQGHGVPRLLSNAAEAMGEVALAWQKEVDPLLEQLSGIADKDSPEYAAAEKTLRRMREEYLLKELVNRNFLPGHGFPTNVVAFVNSNRESIQRDKKRRDDGAEREDAMSRYRSFPSRDLEMALSEYAPGNTLVLDGQVYRSAGVTLNWKLPPGDQPIRELQCIEHAWRCLRCGASGVSPSPVNECRNSTCTRRDEIRKVKFLRPAGFAVDFTEDTTNDLTKTPFVPAEDPWIAGSGSPWQSLPRPELGHYRYSSSGRVFTRSGGVYGNGYRVCLQCGRAAAEKSESGSEMPAEMEAHRPLRGGRARAEDGTCLGNYRPYALQPNLWLGFSHETDIVELQLRDPRRPQGTLLTEGLGAVAVALRGALADRLGIEPSEIGWAVVPSRNPITEVRELAIALYDTATGGAGYVSRFVDAIPELLADARRRLECPRSCDRACHGCLLAFDTQYDIEKLDRRAGIDLLNDQMLASFQLPKDLQVFGAGTQIEFEDLSMAVHREVTRPSADRLRVWVGGDPSITAIDAWRLRPFLFQWAASGVRVELVINETLLSSLGDDEKALLAAWHEAEVVTLRKASDDEMRVAGAWLACEVGDAQNRVRFAVTDPSAVLAGTAWGEGPALRVLRGIVQGAEMPAIGKAVTASELRRLPAGVMHQTNVAEALNIPIRDFGTHFWKSLGARIPSLKQKLGNGSKLASIEYRDRYMNTPLVMRAFYELVRSLRDDWTSIDTGTRVTVDTIFTQQDPRRIPTNVSDDWYQRASRKDIFSQMFNGWDVEASWNEHPRGKSQHARFMQLRWTDGATWSCFLDEGLGFLIGAENSKHPFGQPATEEARSLIGVQFTARSRSTRSLAHATEVETPRGS